MSKWSKPFPRVTPSQHLSRKYDEWIHSEPQAGLFIIGRTDRRGDAYYLVLERCKGDRGHYFRTVGGHSCYPPELAVFCDKYDNAGRDYERQTELFLASRMIPREAN